VRVSTPTSNLSSSVTQGGEANGYGLYLLQGKPVFTYNLLDMERFRWEGGQALTNAGMPALANLSARGAGALQRLARIND